MQHVHSAFCMLGLNMSYLLAVYVCVYLSVIIV